MNDSGDEQRVGNAAPDDAASQQIARAQIERQLQDAFRLAGDIPQCRQLLEFVLEYRLGQQR